jgi:LysM repeat protein
MKHLLPVALVIMIVFSALGLNAQTLPRFQKHYVLDGETATSIARSFNVPFTDFCLLNDFPETVKLTPGQQVLIKQLGAGEEEVIETAPLPTRKAVIKNPAKEEELTTAAEASKPAPARETAPARTAPAREVAVVNEEKPGVTPPSTKAVEVGPHGIKYNVSKDEYHVVQKNQTFFRIALIYGLTIDELKELNNLSTTTVEIGQRLKVRK